MCLPEPKDITDAMCAIDRILAERFGIEDTKSTVLRLLAWYTLCSGLSNKEIVEKDCFFSKRNLYTPTRAADDFHDFKNKLQKFFDDRNIQEKVRKNRIYIILKRHGFGALEELKPSGNGLKGLMIKDPMYSSNKLVQEKSLDLIRRTEIYISDESISADEKKKVVGSIVEIYENSHKSNFRRV